MTEIQLQAIIDATYAQIAAIQAEKSAIVTELSTLSSGSADVGSVSSSGKEGSESYTRETLTSKIKQLSETEAILTKTLQDQCELKVALFPYTLITKVV